MSQIFQLRQSSAQADHILWRHEPPCLCFVRTCANEGARVRCAVLARCRVQLPRRHLQRD
jgi:hypothetical protein